MNTALQERIEGNLARIEADGLTRKLVVPNGIDLSSNDFLCLAKDERIKASMIRAVNREGVGSTGSRLLRGERDCFAAVEKQFAEWKKTERALYFNSGYQANIGLLTAFLENGDTIFSDELNHASIIDGIRLAKAKRVIFKHRDTDEIAELLRETETSGQKFLVTESLFSMDGTIAPLRKYAEICAATNTNLIVDEAHAVGVFGANGSGLIEETGIEKAVFLSMNTAGKAMGASGAFVAGSDWAIEYLINKARSFIFSTAPLPAIADALQTSIKIIRDEKAGREKLLNLSKSFRQLLNENGVNVTSDNSQIVPIIVGESRKAVEIAVSLQAKGYDVRAIRPPTVAENAARLRVSLNVGLSEDILREFVGELTLYLREKI
ncbi:MAG TPA: 8-amino-7-oxononanoate synthase [Pyrinomonadaceae bacterium]|nr:8-amino-7-oxononanoate synthase [Pyrinomonadaceae bacterium]